MENTEIQYRFLEVKDANQLASLYLTIFGKPVDPSYFEIKYSLNNSGKRQLTTVALIGEKIIGCFGVLVQDFENKDKENVYSLAQSCDFFMLPDYQGKGVFKKLYEHSRAECQKQGLDMYAFHSTQTDKVCRKWGWEDQAAMSRFHIKVFPFSTSRIVRILGLKSWRINKINRLLNGFKVGKSLQEINRISGQYTNSYSDSFFKSKAFCERQFVEIHGCILLLKYDYVLTIGLVQFSDNSDVPSMLKILRKLARKSMIHEVVFQVHSSSSEANKLGEFLEEKPSFPISSISFDETNPSFSEVKLNLLDMDIF